MPDNTVCTEIMAFNLTIDQGNTTSKLALWTAGGKMESSCHKMHLVARDIAGIAPGDEIDTAIYCTVLQRQATVLRALERRARKVIEFTASTPIPLRISYNSPQTLGLDRLAAAVGAAALEGCHGREILVVDLGTAITYDRVSDDAEYCGGNIAPGIYMRLKSLNHYTARLPLVNPKETDVPVWGHDTRSALLGGAVRGVVAEIEYYHSLCGKEAATVLTGGDAGMIAPLLSFPTLIEPDLVSKGLNDIIEYNR